METIERHLDSVFMEGAARLSSQIAGKTSESNKSSCQLQGLLYFRKNYTSYNRTTIKEVLL